ncbi:MAG: serine/threonine protein kinase [Myxococcales bacterium]|nr:serine/threonine protein kinase [Myxococcales bacterium]
MLGLLGEGGIARVYRARHTALGSLHALKVLWVDRPSVRERAVREGRVQATIRHPNVVAVTDIVTHQGAPALVLEYVAGPSLEQLLAVRRPSLAEVDRVARGTLRGVAHAHQHGVVHRDLKPGNILLELSDEGLVPRVTDFGIAKLLGAVGQGLRTQAGAVMGTPAYMSPEQLTDASRVDERTDVWALGVLLFEMCTGRTPYEPFEERPLLERIMAGERQRVRDLVPELPERMVRAIEGALHGDRDRRLPDAAAMLKVWCGGAQAVPELEGGWSSTTMAAAYELRPQLVGTGEEPSTLRPQGRSRIPMRWMVALPLLALATVAVAVVAILVIVFG